MRRSLLTYEKVEASAVFGGSEAQAFWFVEDVKADMSELAQKLDEAGRTADARKVVIGQREALMRETLGWVRHWQADVAGNLKPTPYSLAMVEAKILAALEAGK